MASVTTVTQSEIERVRLQLYTAPTTEPVSLDEIKAQCRVDWSDEDVLLEHHGKAARVALENRLERAFITQTWKQYLYCFPMGDEPIRLRRPPLISVSSVSYRDYLGATQTFSDITTDSSGDPAYIYPAYGYEWPDTRGPGYAVTVTYTAGYGSASSVPTPIKQAILMIASWYFWKREPELMDWTSIDSLCGEYLARPYP